MMMGRNSGCLPIVEHGRLAGIVTTTDLMRVLSRNAGAPRATA
jgi:CBS domain-containing protein